MFSYLKRILGSEGGFATVPGTASTLASMDVAAIRRTAWKTQAKEDSVRPSVFTDVKTIFQIVGDEIMVLKPGVVLDVSNIGKDNRAGGQTVRMTLRTPLREAPREGSGEDQLGWEDETDLLYTTGYYNEIKKSVKYNTYGYDFNDTEYLNYVQGYSKYVGLFWQELDDHRYQTALLLGFSNELTKTPVSQVQTFNPNWAIPNLDPSAYPSWDSTAITATDGAQDSDYFYPNRSFSGASTFVENIAQACLDAAGHGATSNAVLNVDSIYEICSHIVDMHIVEPLMIGGQPSYIWKMPPKVIAWMLNPNNTGSLGNYWDAVANYSDKRPWLPGEIGTLMGQFIVVNDPRCPTMTIAGNQGGRTITPGYIRPGNNDDRNTSAWSNSSGNSNFNFWVTCIMGNMALMKYTRDDLVTDLVETTEYKKREGKGSYKGEGINIPRFDKGTPTDTSLIYRGSCIVPVSWKKVRSA